MAAAFFNTLADQSKARAISAGTHPAERVNPVVAEAMREAGIDVGANRPQRLTDDLARQATLLVTMGCGEECPYVPGVERDDWPLDDPAGQPLERVRAIRDDIQRRVHTLVTRKGIVATL